MISLPSYASIKQSCQQAPKASYHRCTDQPTPADTTTPFPVTEVKHYCRQMHSCAEAVFHYKVCGRATLDRDKDGVPCEEICGGNK